jgi:hypothetical protein
VLEAIARDPAAILTRAGVVPDPWQRDVLRSKAKRTLLLCSRQSGKSTTSAALVLRAILTEPEALVLLLSPSERQSAELLIKVTQLYRSLGRPVPTLRPQDNALRMELSNGARVLALPGKEQTLRGYSGVRLLVVDEAARVADDLYRTIRPMLAVSGGRLIALSTPFGQRGWFFDAWQSSEDWQRIKITAAQCPRISKEFLAEERLALGERWYRQEYFCSFEDVVGAVFSADAIREMFTDDVKPFFPQGSPEDEPDTAGAGVGPEPFFASGEL